MKRIALHSVPRSGSSWLGQIFNSSPELIFKYQPLFSYAFKNVLNEKSNKKDILDFFTKISETNDHFLDSEKQIEAGIYPDFIKTDPKFIAYKSVRYHYLLKNMLSKDDELLVICLIRNPKGVMNSWFKAPKEFDIDSWSEVDEWFLAMSKNGGKPENYFGFSGWKRAYELFMQLQRSYPSRVLIVEYDDLLADLKSKVLELFDFCEIPFSNETEQYLIQSRSKKSSDPYSVYDDKILDDEWKTGLNEEIIKEINKQLMSMGIHRY